MLKALRVAAEVYTWLEERQEGRVHSVFAKACNLAWGDMLISLVMPGHGLVPGGVAVALPGQGEWGFRSGESVRWDSATHRLLGARAAVDLSGADVWCNRKPLAVVAPGAVVAGRVTELEALVRAQGCGELAALVRLNWPALPPNPMQWSSFARAPIQALLQATASADAAAAEGALRSLIGLGEGLTPSCDDFLLGLLAVLHYGRGALSPRQADFGGWLSDRAAVLGTAGTTPVSANYLRLAAGGRFGESIEAVVLALLSDGAANMVGAALELIKTGHSSGTDSLVGVLCGATVIISNDQGRRTAQ